MTYPDYMYTKREQPRTDGDRIVMKIDGEPSVIERRGSDIEALGNLMQRAATTLERFGDGSLGSGLSIDGLRKESRELFEDLRTAGELYTPSGETLVDYAAALDTVQSETDTKVWRSESSWESVRTYAYELRATLENQDRYDTRAESASGSSDLGDRPSSTTDQALFDGAVTEWNSYWGAYDAPVADWERAYNTAVRGLEGANESGPEDGFWDNAMPFVEGLLVVLAVIGLIAFVLCFFFTGPLLAVFAAVALVAGIVSVALEASKFLAGRGDWLSLGLSIAGIVPFAKLATLGKFMKAMPSGSSGVSKFIGGARHLGGDLGDGIRAFRGMNPRISGFLPSLPFELGIAGAGHFLVRHTPQLIRGNRARWQNLAGFPGGPTNLFEGLMGSAQAYTGVLGAIVTGSGLIGEEH